MGVFVRTTKDGVKRYYARFAANGKLIVKVTPARTRNEAELYLAQWRLEAAKGEFFEWQKKKVGFSEWAAEYLGLKRLQGLKSIDRVELSVKHLDKFFGDFFLHAITKRDILRYINQRKNTISNRHPHDNISNATVNRELATMKNMLREAHKMGVIDITKPLPHVQLLKEDNVRDRNLTEDEYCRLLDAASPHLRGLILCAYETGMRKGEILNLTWNQVDLQEKMIYLKGENTKTGFGRKIPISPVLDEYLKTLPRSIKTNHVFNYRGKSISYFKRAWKSALRRAGIEDLRFHDLRHAFVTRMRRASVHDHVIMAITGHKTRSVFRRYDTVDTEDLLDAVQRGDTRGDTRRFSSETPARK